MKHPTKDSHWICRKYAGFLILVVINATKASSSVGTQTEICGSNDFSPVII
jgi:hypothetical protein